MCANTPVVKWKQKKNKSKQKVQNKEQIKSYHPFLLKQKIIKTGSNNPSFKSNSQRIKSYPILTAVLLGKSTLSAVRLLKPDV